MSCLLSDTLKVDYCLAQGHVSTNPGTSGLLPDLNRLLSGPQAEPQQTELLLPSLEL